MLKKLSRMISARSIAAVVVVAATMLIFGCSTGIIDVHPQTTPQNKVQEKHIAPGFYRVTQDVSTFKEPDLGSSSIGRIEAGSIVEVIGDAGAFAQVKLSENAAWLRRNQIENTEVPDVVRTLGRVRTKEAPSELSADLDILDSGRLLTIKKRSGEWVLVKISDNRGWLLAGALEPLGSTTKMATLEAVPSYWKLTKRANLRSRPTTNSRILKTLPAKTKVAFLGKEGEWVRVSYGSLTGYIHEDLVAPED